MSYQSNVVRNPQTVEYGKFVEIEGDARFPAVSVIRQQYPDYSQAYNIPLSTQPVSSVDIYPKYGVITYLANASDIKLTLSASEVDIGNVGLVDHYTTGFDTYASVIQTNTAPGGQSMGAVSVKPYGITDVRTTGTAAVSGSVTVINPISSVTVTNTVAISTTQTLPVSVVNPVTSVLVSTNSNTLAVSGNVTITNTVPVSGSVTVVSPVTSVLVYTNSNILAVSGNTVVTNTVAISTAQTLPISGSITILNPVSTVNVTGSVATNFNPTQVDAFNRLRVSNPLTLFDSSHRFKDNNLWSTLSAGGGSVAFNLTQGLMDLNVTNTAGASALRETTKVFAYQPGKSLLVMNTFVMGASATGLVQRVGYFGNENGIYFQMEDDAISFVERSIVTGSLVNTLTPRSNWNGDKLDGTGPSGITLDITKAQIMWMDIEWLGVGTVRAGFIINGQFITCHSFHHANIINSTYITTASLPLRYEIFNKSATAGSKTLKQICSTVISEGGYELNGLQQAVGTVITTPKTLTSAGTYYPVVSIRLKASRLDAIIILTALSMMPVSTGNFSWRVIASGTTGGGGAWQDAGVDSAVEYKLDGTSITGGRILAQGYLTANSTYGNSSITNILKEALFKFQLERNGLTNTPYEITLAVTASTGAESIHASMDWEEVSR
jgi:hypothetical protein